MNFSPSSQKHGYKHVSVHSVELDGRSTGETILAAAASQDCDLLIKGAYTQSRLRE